MNRGPINTESEEILAKSDQGDGMIPEVWSRRHTINHAWRQILNSLDDGPFEIKADLRPWWQIAWCRFQFRIEQIRERIALWIAPWLEQD